MARPGLSVAATIVTIAVLVTLGGLTIGDLVPPAVGHALSHAFVGIPVAVLAYAAVRSWPPARTTAPGRLARRLVVVGLAGFAVGQLLEIVGARVDQPGATAFEDVAHTAGMIVTNLSLLVAVIGGVLSLVAAARDRAVPRWAAVVVAAAMAAALLFLIVGVPGS